MSAEAGMTVDELEALARDAPRIASSETLPPVPPSPPDGWPAEYADDALALRFTERHGDDLRFTAAWGRWSVWDNCVWRQDETLNVIDLARKVCRDKSAECDDDRIAPRIASGATVYAVERLARADRQHAATVDQWDANPWLLNTPGGVVHLKTGKLRSATATIT